MSFQYLMTDKMQKSAVGMTVNLVVALDVAQRCAGTTTMPGPTRA
jgi:hypothetical protein